MIGTLLDGARPDQRWPSLREAGSLLVGGLRTRAGTATRRPAQMIWADGLQLAVLASLALSIGSGIHWMYWSARSNHLIQLGSSSLPQEWWAAAGVAMLVVSAMAFVAIARGWTAAALPLISAGLLFALAGYALLRGYPFDSVDTWARAIRGESLLYVVAALGAAIMLRVRPTAVRWPAAVLAIGPAVLIGTLEVLDFVLAARFAWYPLMVVAYAVMFVAVVLFAVVWTVVDTRVAFVFIGPAVAVSLDEVVTLVAFGPARAANALETTSIAVTAAALAVAVWLGVRRQSAS